MSRETEDLSSPPPILVMAETTMSVGSAELSADQTLLVVDTDALADFTNQATAVIEGASQ